MTVYTEEERKAYEAELSLEKVVTEPVPVLVEPAIRRPGNIEPMDGKLPRNRDIRLAVKDWTEQQISQWPSVKFLTLNFKMKVMTSTGHLVGLDEQTARREIKKFGNRVDRAVHRNLVQRFNRRVRRIPFLEYGQDRGWHCHILMEMPVDMADVRFHQIVKEAWSKSAWSADLDDRAGDDMASRYLTKYRSKSELEAWSDTIVLEAVVVSTK